VLHLFPHWNWEGMEGKDIAVWVYSNLDSAELFLNGKSLGSKDVNKDSHVAWVVPYAPGTIEARGSKGGQVAMTAKRETTSAAAKLVMKADRQEISADGEDVAMFAVEVQDAQGRVLPATDNIVKFSISDGGRLIGVGNGDPTDHESDKGAIRKAFCGYCMAIVQSTKSAGTITIEATSPGLSSASVTIANRQVNLRPQVAPWKREVPSGPGLTGLWRPIVGSGGATGPLATFAGDGAVVFTLHQEGSSLTGTMEVAGNDAGIPITDGKVEGTSVHFKAGNNSYSGTIEGDQIELQRTLELGFNPGQPPTMTGPRPAVGPPPEGSDPSRNPNMRFPTSSSVVLHRAEQ
jgi:beta-galactosidase